MAYEPSARGRLLVAFLGLLAAWSRAAYAQDAAIAPELDATPRQPRHVVVAVHSWTGSSQSIVAAALDLLEGAELFQIDGSSILWYEDRAAASGYHVLGAYSLLTTAPITRIQDVLRSIEERLNPKEPAANAGKLLKSDILWVEGLRIEAPSLKLPNPAILETPWGVDALLSSAEPAFVAACEQQREDKSYCSAVRKASQKKRIDVFETAVDAWIGGEFKEGNVVGWAHAHARNEEILGAAVDALLVTDVARARLESQGPDAAHHLFVNAAATLRSRRATEVFPLEVPLGGGGNLADNVVAWLDAVSARAAKERIVPRRAVVFVMGPEQVRGAIVGTKLADKAEPVAVVSVSAVEVFEGGGSPREPRSFTVNVKVPPPKMPRK